MTGFPRGKEIKMAIENNKEHKPCPNCRVDNDSSVERYTNPDDEDCTPWLRCLECGYTNFEEVWNG